MKIINTSNNPVSHTVVLTDIDDCLILSKRKCPDHLPLTEGGKNSAGDIISYFTSHHFALMNMFNTSDMVIPVTGRNSAALFRMNANFSSYKIVSHGGIILDEDNNVDKGYLNSLSETFSLLEEYRHTLIDEISTFITDNSLKVRCNTVSDSGIPMYLSIKSDNDHESSLSFILESISIPDFFTIHLNGRNLALIPKSISKENACKYLIEHKLNHLDPLLLIGVGDSCTDLPFMHLCDYAIYPKNSQIQQGIVN